MYSRMKRKSSFIVLVVMVVSLLMVSGTPVHADDYGWMESAKKVKINSTIKGVARNNQPPTLMDPWDSYEEYFYFKAPVKMNITITVTMKGTQGVSVSLYNSRGNYLMDSNDWLYNRSKNQNSTRVIDSNSFETIECNIFGVPCKIIAMTRRKSDERGIVRSTKAR